MNDLIPGGRIEAVELAALARILRRAGWLVLSRRQQMDIEDTLAAIQTGVNAVPAAVAEQVTAAVAARLPTADAIAAAVAARMPPPAAVDLTPVLSAVQAAQDKLASGQQVEQADLASLQTAVAAVQQTLGPVPPPAPAPTP